MSESIVKEVLAATAVVGADLITGDAKAKQPYNRVIYGLSFTGSAAAGDTEAEIRVGGVEKFTIRNTATGLLQSRDGMLPCRIFVPANKQIEAVVMDAAATNPVLLGIYMV